MAKKGGTARYTAKNIKIRRTKGSYRRVNLQFRLQTILAKLTSQKILLVFCFLVLPGVFAPYHSDDYFQLLLLDGNSSLRRDDASVWGLFSFIDRIPEHRQQMLQYGILPWFAADDFYFRFWRPVAELSHWLDYQFFGSAPLPAHIHSTIWFVLLCLPVYGLARHTLSQKTILPLLVLAIFAWDGQHVATIGWIANRNALMAAVFSMLALYAHIYWRETGRKRFVFSALPLSVAALLSSESALALGGYLFFYAVFLDVKGFKKGFLALMPYLLIAAAWLYCYLSLGFGVNTSAGLYLNPFLETVEYMQAVIFRMPIYVTASILPIPSGVSWIGGGDYAWIGNLFFVFSIIFTVTLILVFYHFFRKDRVILFWFFSSLVSVVPVCSTMAQDRLALFQTIGMDIVIAAIIYNHVFKNGKSLQKASAYLLVMIHLVLSPLHLLAGSVYMHWGAKKILSNALFFKDEDIRDKSIVVMQAPIGEAVSLMGIRQVMKSDMPKQFLWIANDEGGVTIKVLSQYELLIGKSSGFVSGFESAFRSVRKDPFYTGEKISVISGEIEILHINTRGFPDKIKLRMNAPLLDESQIFYTYKKGRYEKLDLPDIGEVLKL